MSYLKEPHKLKDRCRMILDWFSENYFGHLPMGLPSWNELEMFFEAFIESGVKFGRTDDLHTVQNELVEIFEKHPLNKYPMSPKQKSYSIKWLKNIFEKTNAMIFDPKLETILNSYPIIGEEPEYIFKTYLKVFWPQITMLEENRDIIGHGTTGLATWQGAIFLGDWCLSNTELFEGKNILELGSGAGLLGISMLKELSMSSYTFTDCHWRVINALKFNIKINFEDFESKNWTRDYLQQKTCTGCEEYIENDEEAKSFSYSHHKFNQQKIFIKYLDWTNFELNNFPDIDVIIGSDIVYERTTLRPLSKVLKSLLKAKKNSTALIACTERSHTTIECFEDALKQEGLVHDTLFRKHLAPSETFLSCDVQHHAIKLYKIDLKE